MTTTATAASSHILTSERLSQRLNLVRVWKNENWLEFFTREHVWNSSRVSDVKVYLSKVTRDVTIMPFVHTSMSEYYHARLIHCYYWVLSRRLLTDGWDTGNNRDLSKLRNTWLEIHFEKIILMNYVMVECNKMDDPCYCAPQQWGDGWCGKGQFSQDSFEALFMSECPAVIRCVKRADINCYI